MVRIGMTPTDLQAIEHRKAFNKSSENRENKIGNLIEVARTIEQRGSWQIDLQTHPQHTEMSE